MSFVRIGKEQYHVVRRLLSGEESVFLPFPLSILDGIVDGIVFVDDQDDPQCAAVMSTDLVGGRLIGHVVDDEFNHGFVSFMKKQSFLTDETPPKFRVFWWSVSETWDALIFQIFGYKVFRIGRTQFRFNRDVFESRVPAQICEGLHSIDATIIQSSAALRWEIEDLWGSVENYVKRGVGWISLSSDGEIMGQCIAAFLGGGLAELSIRVHKSKRGAGLGFQLASIFIKDCLDRGILPNWTCDTVNIPSFRLAQKLGFVEDSQYYMFASVYTPLSHEPGRQDH